MVDILATEWGGYKKLCTGKAYNSTPFQALYDPPVNVWVWHPIRLFVKRLAVDLEFCKKKVAFDTSRICYLHRVTFATFY